MIMVTHDLEEAVYLADRVLILPRIKGRAARLIDIDLPRPRSLASRETKQFVEYVARIPGIGRMAALRDPTGALFALFTPQVK